MRRKYSMDDLKKCKYPNLIAEFMESGYSISTLSNHMGNGPAEEDDPLMNAKLFGEEDFCLHEAEGLTNLFSCKIDYLFSNKLEEKDGRPLAYYRHLRMNLLQEMNIEQTKILDEIRTKLRQKPTWIYIVRDMLKLPEESLTQICEIVEGAAVKGLFGKERTHE